MMDNKLKKEKLSLLEKILNCKLRRSTNKPFYSIKNNGKNKLWNKTPYNIINFSDIDNITLYVNNGRKLLYNKLCRSPDLIMIECSRPNYLCYKLLFIKDLENINI